MYINKYIRYHVYNTIKLVVGEGCRYLHISSIILVKSIINNIIFIYLYIYYYFIVIQLIHLNIK